MTEMPETDWPRVLAENAIRRVERVHRLREEHRTRGRAASLRVAAWLSREPGVQRVILFGSLTAGGIVHEHSDIDIAVEGLPADREALAWRAIRDLAEMPVDLLRLESLPAAFRKRIEQDGEVLFVAA